MTISNKGIQISNNIQIFQQKNKTYVNLFVRVIN